MNLRRALLLFAIVLALAALATAVSGPQSRDGRRQAVVPPRSQPTARPRPSAQPLRLRITQSGGPARHRIPAGRRAELSVEVEQPGLVELAGLGLSADAEPLTPARFELLVNRPGSYPVEVTPAGSTERRRIGVLRVLPPA